MIRTYISKLLSPTLKSYIRNLQGKTRHYDWSDVQKIIKKEAKICSDNMRIGFVTSSGGHRAGNLFEPGLSLALNNSGIKTSVLLCDGALSACNISEYGNQSKKIDKFIIGGPKKTGTCNDCINRGIETWKTTCSDIYTYSNYVDNSKISYFTKDFIKDFKFKYRGHEIGEHVKSASLRFLCRGTFDFDQPETIKIIKRYFDAAIDTVDVAIGYFNDFKPDAIICFHGIYIPHGVLGEIARSNGIRVINWNTSYRQRRVLISEGDTYHKTMCYEDSKKWDIDLNQEQITEITRYLLSRETGEEDWQQFNDNPDMDIFNDKVLNNFIKKYDRSFLLIPNVIWDAQLQYEPTFFKNMTEWVVETIKIFSKNPSIGLIIRIHPAEVRRYSATREPLMEIIKNNFEQLPENVHIINAHEEHSTYRLAENVYASIIYGTKTGLELAAVGHPVVVCGEAWIKDKGISFDPKSIEEYTHILERAELVMTKSMKEKAVRFAYHFFERAALTIEFLKPVKKNIAPDIDSENINIIYDESSKGLNIILDEVINKKGNFIGGKL